MLISEVTYKATQAAYARHGYAFFAGGPYDLNLFAIRSDNRDFGRDTFDDFICVAYLDDRLRQQMFICRGTTDPGLTHITHPVFAEAIRNGTAFIAPGQYRGAYAPGWHGAGSYWHEALVQVRPMEYFRVKDADGNIPYLDACPRQSGLFATNLHHAWASGTPERVGNASAGCVVCQRAKDLVTILTLAKTQDARGFGALLTFTLFNENRFLAK